MPIKHKPLENHAAVTHIKLNASVFLYKNICSNAIHTVYVLLIECSESDFIDLSICTDN